MRWLALLGIIGSLLLCACNHPAPAPVPTKGPAVVVSFDDLFKPDFKPPDRCRDLTGVASYSTAMDVTGQGEVNAPADQPHLVVYLMVNAQNPLQAVLVGSHEPMSLNFFREKKSTKATVEGDLQTFPKSDLIKYFKDQQGVDLAQYNGMPLWVDNDVPLAPSSSGSPSGASPTPSAQPSSKERSQHQNEENAPFDRELVWNPR